MKYKTHIIWAVIAAIALAGGVVWGRSMVGSVAGRAASNGAFAGRSFTGRMGAGGGFVLGQVASVGSSTLTLQLANGNSEVVFYSTSTAITEPQTVPASRIAECANVTIIGTPNADGSMTASAIQVGGGGFRGGAGGAPTTTP